MIILACFDCGYEWNWEPEDQVPDCPECGSADVLDTETDEIPKIEVGAS